MASVVGSSYVSWELMAILVFLKIYQKMNLLLFKSRFFYFIEMTNLRTNNWWWRSTFS